MQHATDRTDSRQADDSYQLPTVHEQVADPLSDVLRSGARQMLVQPVEAEVAAWIDERTHLTDERGRRELWVTLDTNRIPLRLEIFDRRTATRRYTDYVNWQSDLYIPDAFFEPEPAAKLQKLGFEEYLSRTLEEGSVGPVPVLYTNLLYQKQED